MTPLVDCSIENDLCVPDSSITSFGRKSPLAVYVFHLVVMDKKKKSGSRCVHPLSAVEILYTMYSWKKQKSLLL